AARYLPPAFRDARCHGHVPVPQRVSRESRGQEPDGSADPGAAGRARSVGLPVRPQLLFRVQLRIVRRDMNRIRATTIAACALLLSAAGLVTLAFGASPTPASAATAPTSVRDSPGWYPTVDPESMSVVIGRRTHAPLVKMPLTGGAHSLKEMGRTV